MQIIRATAAGFCSGVKGALKTAEQALQEPDLRPGSEPGNRARTESAERFTLGPIVHNRLVVERLKERGFTLPKTWRNRKVRVRWLFGRTV